jgi:hypothetical protein
MRLSAQGFIRRIMTNLVNPYRFAAAGGGVPVVEDYEFTENQDATTITFTAPAGIQSGELLLILGMADTNSSQAWSTPAGWTKHAAVQAQNTSYVILYKIADGTETDVTVTNNFADQLGWYIRVSGANATPIDAYAFSQTVTGPTHVITAITTTVDNCLAIYGLSHDGGDGLPFSVAGAGWTEEAEGQAGTAIGDASACWGTKEQASAGSTGNATVTASVSNGSSSYQLAIAPA